MNNELRVLSLFSGIGAFEEALTNIDLEYEIVNYCEFDKEIARAYSIIHKIPIEKNLGDIKQVNEKELQNFDLMTYGFPCQDISALGDQKGFYDKERNLTRSGLFFEAMRIAKHKKPKYMIAENVKALKTKPMAQDYAAMLKILDELGYNNYDAILNSKDYGIPHSRNRVYIVSIRKDIDDGNFKFPSKKELKTIASDYYDKFIVGDEYYLRQSDMKYLSEFRIKKQYSSLNKDIIVCQTTKQGNLANPQNFIEDKKGKRVMTPRELLALQGFKREYGDLLLKNGFTKEKIGYMSGNSITVKVLEYIFENLFKTVCNKTHF